jgi:N-hydroxyarylamine O-acetyltransferase
VKLEFAAAMPEIPSYLDRISYSGPTAPTLGILRALHRAHLLAVPFENLDIGIGQKIIIDEDAFVRKVAKLRRGGFCYELNGAFAALLRALGFQVTLLSAGVARANGSCGREFDHLALRVDLVEPWLADVGFGDSFLEPLRLQVGLEQNDPAGRFQLVQAGDRIEMERTQPDGTWKRQYSFTLQPRSLEDFAGMCHYHQTSPDSSFTQNRICSLATPDGRVTLSGMKLIETRGGQKTELILTSNEEWHEVLRERFGITLESNELARSD